MSGNIDTAGYVEVRLDALARNYARIQRAAESAEVGAVVKANGYGLGAARVAQCLLELGCRSFYVATLEEGVALRQALAGREASAVVYVFEGFRPGKAHVYTQHELCPVLNTVSQVEAWTEVAAPCAIQVDSGMSRLGVSTDELNELLADAALIGRIGLCHVLTHLACADDPQSACNARQLEVFSAVKALPGNVTVSIANSAGTYLGASYHADLVRAGIGLYGGNPFVARDNPMDPVAALFGRVLQIRELQRPAYVGYGATYEASAGTRIATLGVGYADGYPRILGNKAQVAYGGIRLAVIGRVSMDLTCIDISALDEGSISVGDYVEMFGANVKVDEIAALSSTISYEVLTGLNARLPRVYLE